MTRRLIRASELGEYTFCAKAWWLRRVVEVPSTNIAELSAGTRAHAAHARRILLVRGLRVAAVVCAALALLRACMG